MKEKCLSSLESTEVSTKRKNEQSESENFLV